jgi:putative membrane protein
VNWARLGLLVATVIGLAVACGTVGAAGAHQVFAAMTAIGWAGMAAFLGCSVVVMFLVGAAWLAAAPGEPVRRLGLFTWARMTREAAADVLPFSQLGGLVVGARTLAARGVSDPVIYASMIADMSMEMAAQLLFTLAGLATLLAVTTHAGVDAGIVPLAVGGMGVSFAFMLIFWIGQRPLLKLAGAAAARMLPGSAATLAAVQARLGETYRSRGHMAASFAFNFAAWTGSAVTAWVALRFMGSTAPLWGVIAVEALIFTLRSVAFFVPGAVGVQEVAYTLIGPLFGLPPTTALALSLLKRARDLIVGVPAILIWQAGEVGALRAKPV